MDYQEEELTEKELLDLEEKNRLRNIKTTTKEILQRNEEKLFALQSELTESYKRYDLLSAKLQKELNMRKEIKERSYLYNNYYDLANINEENLSDEEDNNEMKRLDKKIIYKLDNELERLYSDIDKKIENNLKPLKELQDIEKDDDLDYVKSVFPSICVKFTETIFDKDELEKIEREKKELKEKEKKKKKKKKKKEK